MSRIGLIFPKSTFLINPLVYPPLGLWYIAAQLEKMGIETEFFDLSSEHYPLPADGEFDELWISATSSQMAEVRRLDRTFVTYSQTRTVLGGPVTWSSPELSGFDVVVVGEADHPETIRNILEHEGVITVPTFDDLSYVLPPSRKWAHMYVAHLKGIDGLPKKTTTMITSRGCPWRCAFCETGRDGFMKSKVRFIPLETVLEEIRGLYDIGFHGIQFYDDTFPIKKDRTYEIMARLAAFDFTWRCFMRSDLAIHNGKFFLNDMHQHGLVEVLVGVESGNNTIKKNIHKDTTIEQDTEFLKWCKDVGVSYKASVILGLPGETRETMQDSLDWILRERPDRVDLNILLPMPGTPLTRNVKDYDCYWTSEVPEEYWFKGAQKELVSLVGTSALSPQEITDFHAMAIEKIEAAGIPY